MVKDEVYVLCVVWVYVLYEFIMWLCACVHAYVVWASVYYMHHVRVCYVYVSACECVRMHVCDDGTDDNNNADNDDEEHDQQLQQQQQQATHIITY